MKSISVRGVRIGEGMPKIIAPIVGASGAEILAEADEIRSAGADIAEWRIDLFAQGADVPTVIAAAARLREALGDIPLLITFRTAKEGGAKAIDPEAYAALLEDVCAAKAADMIDVEAFMGEAVFRCVLAAARANGVCTVASNHDFHATPDEDELLNRLRRMADMGADIAKIAVMPRSRRDVLALLSATARAVEELDCPLITMSMGAMGAVSRISGECFGSACTFGSVRSASAPGQIPLARLKQMLKALHMEVPE